MTTQLQAQAQTIASYLAQSSWYQVLALRTVQQLPRHAQQTKAQLIAELAHHLVQPATLLASITQLDTPGKEAVRALLAAHGALPVHTFDQRFGPIRPYRPWRKAATDTPPQPWLAPISTTETLWYLGLIFRDPPKPTPGRLQHYVIPADLLPALAAHWPTTTHDTNHTTLWPRPGRPADLLVHLGLWLASLVAEPLVPLQGRWLPPRLVATLAQRTGLDQAPDFRPQRSERHVPYLAFLHYLAEAAELVAGSAPLSITPHGWLWLAAPPAERWRTLWQAWLAAPAQQALPYRFPWADFSPQTRQQILTALHPLPLDRWLPLFAQIAQWRLQDRYGQLPAPLIPYAEAADAAEDGESAPQRAIDPVATFCTGALFWLGLLDVADVADATGPVIRLTAHGAWLLHDQPWRVPAVPAVPATLAKGAPDTLLLPVQALPLHLAQLAPFCRWQAPTAPGIPPLTVAQALTLDAARIGQAAAQGCQPEQMLHYLAAALGHPPSRRLRQRIQRWAAQGQQLRLRPLLVLETATPDLLAQLRRHKLVRRRLGPGLAPNRVTLNPLDVAPLLQTLHTLGHVVAAAPTSLAEITAAAHALTRDPAPRPMAHLPPAWQWLLLRLYQQLGQWIELPLTPPWPVQQGLLAQLTPLQQVAAEASADQLVQQIARALDGYLALPAWASAPADPAPLSPADLLPRLQAAITAGHDLTIHYAGASRGNLTTRRLTPFRLEEQHGVSYLIAWCHLRQAERVFRVDRIEAVRSPQSTGGEPQS